MEEKQAQSLAPPEGLRPAELGIVVLGRVILGHISATIIDLERRGFLRIDEIPGDGDPDWELTDLRGPAASRNTLLRYEVTLLDGLFARRPVVRLSEIGQRLVPVLNRVRARLRRDAVRHGRLRRWHREQRTPRGEQLLKQVQVFRRDLRALAGSGNSRELTALAPYAMVFGISVPSAVSFSVHDTHDTQTDKRRDSEGQWSQSDRFATSWLAVCATFSPSLRYGHRPGTGRPDDFAHEWSASHDHGHSSHSHGSGHGGYGGGHADLGGGHGADFGGGHGGH